MEPNYAREYRALYTTHWWWRAREEWIMHVLTRRQPSGGWRTALDVGCADGLLFDRLGRVAASVEGLEPDAGSVMPDGAHRSRITIGPFDDTFRPGKRFSLILMLDVLEHIADPASALRRVADLLEPGGLFVATVPAFMALWTAHDELNRHYTRYRRGRLRALAEGAGLTVEEAKYFFCWLAPAKLCLHFVENVTHPTPSVPRIPPRWLNRTLYALSRAEQRAIGILPIPFGGSLLLVARRAPRSCEP